MKYVVLLSSGLDSSVNLYESHEKGEVVLALNFDYGQKAAEPEKRSAQKLAERLKIPFKVLQLPWFKEFGKSSLISLEKFPTGSDVDIHSRDQSLKTAKSVWVPNRNGIFLNIAAGFAEALGAQAVVPGFNLEEAQTFPDNSVSFMKVLDSSFSFSTANHVKVHCFTAEKQKTEIIQRALQLKVPLQDLWPCYDAQEKWCGVCESCLRAKRAFQANQIETSKYFLD